MLTGIALFYLFLGFITTLVWAKQHLRTVVFLPLGAWLVGSTLWGMFWFMVTVVVVLILMFVQWIAPFVTT